MSLDGTRIGKLVVRNRVKNPVGYKYVWECVCDCGIVVVRRQGNLRIAIKNGAVASCGCSPSRLTHGESKTRLARILAGMKTRCSNPKREKWKQYGGRGIRVCDEWANSYEAFRDWAIANGYSDNKTIDRKDNDGNYTPDNCRWVPNVIQARNKSTSRKITHNGETLTVVQWADRLGINRNTLQTRYTEGWPVERMLATPTCGAKMKES